MTSDSSTDSSRWQLYIAYAGLAIAILTLVVGLSVQEVRHGLCQRFGLFCSAEIDELKFFAFDYKPPPLPEKLGDEPLNDPATHEVLLLLENSLINSDDFIPALNSRRGFDVADGFKKRHNRRLYWQLTIVHPGSPTPQEYVIHTTLFLPESHPHVGDRVERSATRQSEPKATTSRFVSALFVDSRTVESWPNGSYRVVIRVEGSGFSDTASGAFVLAE